MNLLTFLGNTAKYFLFILTFIGLAGLLTLGVSVVMSLFGLIETSDVIAMLIIAAVLAMLGNLKS